MCTYQTPLISKLLLHARQNTNFYRGRVAPASPEKLDRAWSTIPIFSRAEAVTNREALISRSVPAEAGRTESGETSGSTGYPFPYLRSEISKIANLALKERMMRWWKVDGRKAMCQISFDRQRKAPSSHGATSTGWQTTHPKGPFHFLSTAADVETQRTMAGGPQVCLFDLICQPAERACAGMPKIANAAQVRTPVQRRHCPRSGNPRPVPHHLRRRDSRHLWRGGNWPYCRAMS